MERARRIADRPAEQPAKPPGGYTLTVDAFQSLGIVPGGGEGSHQLHHLLENAFVRTAAGHELSDAFQEAVGPILSFATSPLCAVLHEAVHAQGGRPTAWAAEWCARSSRSSTPPRPSRGLSR